MASYLQKIPRVAAAEGEEPPSLLQTAQGVSEPDAVHTTAPFADSPRQTSIPLGNTDRQPVLTPLPLPGDENEVEKGPLDDPNKEKARERADGGNVLSPISSPVKPLPAFPAEGGNTSIAGMPEPNSRGRRSRQSTVRRQSAIDWIVPHGEELNITVAKAPRDRTVGDRLDPTLIKAQVARESFTFNARLTGYALNGAIGMQVILGALTTGLSVVTTGKQTSVMTAILGGISTIMASYLARARGSNEPEISLIKIKDLEQFIRDLEAFRLDHGHITGDRHDTEIDRFRNRFEELLGNVNSEKRTTPPA